MNKHKDAKTPPDTRAWPYSVIDKTVWIVYFKDDNENTH